MALYLFISVLLNLKRTAPPFLFAPPQELNPRRHEIHWPTRCRLPFWSREECRPGRAVPSVRVCQGSNTHDPDEVNWYLYEKVGCRKTSAAGRNYRFDPGGRIGPSPSTSRWAVCHAGPATSSGSPTPLSSEKPNCCTARGWDTWRSMTRLATALNSQRLSSALTKVRLKSAYSLICPVRHGSDWFAVPELSTLSAIYNYFREYAVKPAH